MDRLPLSRVIAFDPPQTVFSYFPYYNFREMFLQHHIYQAILVNKETTVFTIIEYTHLQAVFYFLRNIMMGSIAGSYYCYFRIAFLYGIHCPDIKSFGIFLK